jgi:pimeloyl-ACP methyl ester carboxylesterase
MSKHRLDLSNESLADADSLFIDLNGIKVHYKQLGEGDPALLFLHGFGASLFSWEKVLEPLSRWGKTVSYDRPGFGLTDRPLAFDRRTENPYGTSGQVEMLKGLMDSLGIKEAVIVAHSAGGTVGLAFALKYPQMVKKLLLVAPAVYLYSPVPSWARRFLTKKASRILGMALIHPTRHFVRRILSNVVHDPICVTDDAVDGYEKPFHAINWEAGLWEFSLAPHARNLWKRMDELRMPVMVIAGDNDRVIPTRHSRRLAEITPGAEFVLVKGCGHMPQEEKPNEFLKAVERFFSK